MSRRLVRLFAAATSFAAALVIAEAGAALLRGRAFPYLNIFRPSPRYGVALEPLATARIRTRTGRVTEVRTNSLGFRGGGEWTSGGTLLLGDSQMFGYNVAEADAVAARLAALARRPVLGAAVPSWGPFEYALAVEELAPAHRPTHVIFVANLANDWVESNVPNTKRSDALDGWIRRYRKDAPVTTDFPGRAFLLGRSHLVFAARGVAALTSPSSDLLPGATAADQLLRDLAQLARPKDGFRSRVTPHLVRVTAACARLGCRVIAAGLPLDVSVDAAEWSKYRAEPRDVTPLLALLDAFYEDARALGVPVIDLLPVLREASPGAFLPDDVHLSPRGHEAVARAFAGALGGPLASRSSR